MKLRVVSYNIRHGHDVNHDMAQLAADILAVGADIVGLQEVDVCTSRVHGRDTLCELAHALGWEHYRFCRAIDFAGGGYGIGLFEEEKLLGAWLLYYPIGRDDGLGGEIGLEPEKVAHFELALLDESLRGKGLHGKMVDKLTAYCEADGRFTHMLMTAHPDNKASLCAFTRRGYTVAATKQLYGGVLRSIAVKALQKH